MIRPLIHMLLHVAAPALVARLAWPNQFTRTWLIMLSTMLIDLDHLLADPVYDPNRCSIGFHPLHQYPVVALYALMMIWSKTRILGAGLLIHMLLDGLDCYWMSHET